MVDPAATASLTPAVRGSDTPAIPGYELVRMLGMGGMGRVWRARQLSVGRDVALKILDPHLGQDPSYAERFLREARAAASVHHPNVCACFDAGESDGRQYLALEFVAGGDASELIRRRGGRLGIEEAIGLACDCARGLEAIAAAGLIHRDIKPSNILLTADPTAGGSAKLGDFGLARPADPETRLTRTGAALGTPAYMAPEQARGERSVDIRADLYALGASLFEMLTGEAPFAGDTAYAVVSQVLKGPTPDPRSRNRKVSPALSAVVMRAMARTPAERYASPTEMRIDLEKLARNELPQAFLATAGANLATGILTRPAASARAAEETAASTALSPPRATFWRAAAIALAIGTVGLGAIVLLSDHPRDGEDGARSAAPAATPPLPVHQAPTVTSEPAIGPFEPAEPARAPADAARPPVETPPGPGPAASFPSPAPNPPAPSTPPAPPAPRASAPAPAASASPAPAAHPEPTVAGAPARRQAPAATGDTPPTPAAPSALSPVPAQVSAPAPQATAPAPAPAPATSTATAASGSAPAPAAMPAPAPTPAPAQRPAAASHPPTTPPAATGAAASGTASPLGLPPPPAAPTQPGAGQRSLDALPPPPNVAAP